MISESAFLARVLQRVPAPRAVKDFFFLHWDVQDKPVSEGIGILPVPGADPTRVLNRVMDVDAYPSNVSHVNQCRTIEDPRYQRPGQVRFYQRITVPLLGAVHHELVLSRIGEVESGYEVAFWTMLEAETAALDRKVAARSRFSDGAWFVAPGIVGYALSACPRREDVGFLKWKAMTSGANLAAPKVVQESIENMSAWAARL